jgi:hypothetical protein
MLGKQAGQHFLYILGAQACGHLNGVALPGELVIDTQHLQFGAASALVMDEVIAPDMAWEQSFLRRHLLALVGASSMLFAGWNLTSALLPQAMDPLDVEFLYSSLTA